MTKASREAKEAKIGLAFDPGRKALEMPLPHDRIIRARQLYPSALSRNIRDLSDSICNYKGDDPSLRLLRTAYDKLNEQKPDFASICWKMGTRWVYPFDLPDMPEAFRPFCQECEEDGFSLDVYHALTEDNPPQDDVDVLGYVVTTMRLACNSGDGNHPLLLGWLGACETNPEEFRA